MANDTPETPEVIPPRHMVDPTSTASRSRAYKIRSALRRGADVDSDDLKWFEAFEAAKTSNKSAFAKAKSRVSYTEEHDETGAEGEAAKYAAQEAANYAAPDLARQEGRRFDYMMEIFLRQQQQTFGMMSEMCNSAHRRMAKLEESHVQFMDAQTAMLDAVREHYLARVEAEAELALMKPEEEKDDTITEMAKGFVQAMAERQGIKAPGNDAE